jgi:hypothetical protein
MMICKFCGSPTLMTVKDLKEKVIPCCKKCKDEQNREKQTLTVHLIFLPEENEDKEELIVSSLDDVINNFFNPTEVFNE